MAAKLPTYKGRKPDGYRLNFSGQADNLDHDLGDGESVVLIVRGKIRNPAFKTNQFGVMRLHESVAIDFAELADESTAEQLMQEIKRRQDEEAGQTSIDDEIDAQAEGGTDG